MSDDFDDNRSAGAALAASIELDKDKRGKARSIKPLRQLLPFVWRYPVYGRRFFNLISHISGIDALYP